MKTVALIIPIHPPHYHYIYSFIELLEQHDIQIDLYLVFSNKDHYNQFCQKTKIKEIIIPENITTGNIVTYKKFFTLGLLKDNKSYDYFIVCDAEIKIIPENFTESNILNKINSIFENKTVYSGEQTCFLNITKLSAELICNDNRLIDKTNNYKLYYWWSDLPVYKREHLDDFFSKIDYSNINWNHFDHKIYLNYLILYHDFYLLNVTQLIGHKWSLESYNGDNIEDLIKLKSNNYGFSFIIPKLFLKHREFLMNEGSFLLYHLDRI